MGTPQRELARHKLSRFRPEPRKRSLEREPAPPGTRYPARPARGPDWSSEFEKLLRAGTMKIPYVSL